MKIHPVCLIILGLLICSVGINICLLDSNKKLVYKVQKLEAGPARGLFNTSKDDENKKLLSDEEINELIKQMLKQMIRERIT